MIKAILNLWTKSKNKVQTQDKYISKTGKEYVVTYYWVSFPDGKSPKWTKLELIQGKWVKK